MFVESVKNGKVVLRGAFSDDDYLTARCCDMAVFPKEGLIVVDLNITRRRSLFEFMKYVMKSFVESPMYASKRKEVFGLIAMEYRAIEDRFFQDNSRFLPKHVDGHTMLEHQKKDIVNLVKHKHNLLAWEQGLGKTIEAATASVITQSKNTCVIAPAFVKWGWFKDLATDWGFDQTKFSIFDAARSRSLTAFLQERFVIVNYEMVDRYKDELSKRKFDHIVIDECHKIKNVKSQRYKAIRNLVAKHPEAKITLASGTPIGNRADDLFAYLRLVNHPLGENESYYKKRYLEFGPRGKVVGTRNADELRVRTSNFILRRTQDECLDLPEKIIGRYYFKLDEYRDEYDRILEEIADKQEERMRFLEENSQIIEMYEALKMKSRETGDKNDTSALRLYYQTHVDILSRYNQSENLGGGSSLHSLNRLVSMAKIEGVSELIDQVIENGDKIAVFGSYYGPLEELQKIYGDKAILITGKVDSGKRHELLQRFVNDPECKIYLANMEAGGVGINGVQKVCSDVVFLNFPFVPKDIEQALARVVRQGQKRSVRVYYTICEDSIDEDLYDLVANKAHDNHEILDKGNKRVMDYHNIERKLFNSLLNKKNHVSKPTA